jgi:large subunit ribosomal protein L4
MPKLELYNLDGKGVGEVELAEGVFGVEPKPHLFHNVVRWQLARRRSGTSKAKTRSEIRGSNQKAYKQKGTGRARRGSMNKSPVVRGGGAAHGPKVQDWSYNIPKKVRRSALCSALSQRILDKKFFVIDDLELSEFKTKKVLEILTRFGIEGALFVDGPNERLDRSSRNVPRCNFLRSEGLNVYDVLRHEAVVISASAVKAAEERLSP